MNKHPCLLSVALAAGCVAVGAYAQDAQQPTNFTQRPGVFKITKDVVNENVIPFTATIVGGEENTLRRSGKGGFEPTIFRNRLMASEDSPNRIYTETGGRLDYYDSYASGLLDGADVQVYRIEDGIMELVRRDKVAEGGSVIEQWYRSTSRPISPDTHEAVFKWESWNRDTMAPWFTVFAMDKNGNLSEAATPVQVKKGEVVKEAKRDNNTIHFKVPKEKTETDAPSVPQNFTAADGGDGLVHMSWDPVEDEDLVGYVIGLSYIDPANLRGSYLELENSPEAPEQQIKEGDMIIVSKKMAPFDPAWLSDRVGNLSTQYTKMFPTGVPNGFMPNMPDGRSWTLVKHDANTPVTEPGETYLQMTLPAGAEEKVGKFGIPDISTTKQSFYPVPRPVDYTMEVWVKADRADAPAFTFEWDGDKRVGGFIGHTDFQPTTEWKKYTHTFKGEAADEGNHAYLVLTFRGAATYSIDNYRVYRSDTDYLDYSDETYDRVLDSGVSSLRTHSTIKSFRTTASMDQLTNAGGLTEGTHEGTTLPQLLKIMESSGVDPWLQIEYHMTPEEWEGFVEFMAAPYDPATDTPESKPWAYKRYQQGHPEPWISSFNRVYFEISNETWNALFSPWTFTDMTDSVTGKRYSRGAVYGMFQEYVMDCMRASPYWDDAMEQKIIPVVGGWTGQKYGMEAALESPSSKFVTVGAYNGGWDEGEGPPRPNPASFFNAMSFVNQTAIPRARMLLNQADQIERRTKNHVDIGTYEAGPGYALNGLNGARVTKEQQVEQEKVMKSKVAGVATLDVFLAQAALDFDLQNFFTFGEGNNWTSHTKWYRGGYAHPSFLLLSLFNREGTGDMLQVITESVPTVDNAAYQRRRGVTNAPLMAVYATVKADRVNVFVINRQYPNYPVEGDDGYTPVTLELPFTQAKSITLHRPTGNPDDTNLESEKVMLETQDVATSTLEKNGKFAINASTGGTDAGMPPADVFLYVFEGTDIGQLGNLLSRGELLRKNPSFEEK